LTGSTHTSDGAYVLLPAASCDCLRASAASATIPAVPCLVRYQQPFGGAAKVDIAPLPTFPSTVPPYLAGPLTKLNSSWPSCWAHLPVNGPLKVPLVLKVIGVWPYVGVHPQLKWRIQFPDTGMSHSLSIGGTTYTRSTYTRARDGGNANRGPITSQDHIRHPSMTSQDHSHGRHPQPLPLDVEKSYATADYGALGSNVQSAPPPVFCAISPGSMVHTRCATLSVIVPIWPSACTPASPMVA